MRNFNGAFPAILQTGFIITCWVYYRQLENAKVIDSSGVSIYVACSFVTIFIGAALVFVAASLSRRFGVISVCLLIVQVVAVFTFAGILNPLTSQLRLTIVNTSSQSFNDLRVEGCQDLDIGDIEANESKFLVIQIAEGCGISLLAHGHNYPVFGGSTNGFGFKQTFILLDSSRN